MQKSASLSGYSEATHFIVFTIAAIYFYPFSAQKTHVKPPNHLTRSNQRRSSCHFSYVQSAILNIDRKQSKPRPIAGANLLIISILCASPLIPIFCRHHHLQTIESKDFAAKIPQRWGEGVPLQIEELSQPLGLGPAHRNLGLLRIVHPQLIAGLEPRHHLPNVLNVHHVRPVRPPECLGV